MSAVPTTLTPAIAAGPVVYDANTKMGAMRRIVKSGASGDIEGIIDGFSRIVISWPYEGDPALVESWDDLGRNEFNELIKALSEAFGSAGEA